jgi:chorismate mutase
VPDPSLPPDADLNASLADLRVEIDRIDAAMHELLIERSAIIDTLIAIKAKQGGGSAFRPGREAEMMRRLAGRHRGRLPLDTVESIWRVIISTFTFLQARYAVHADMSGGDAAMRDTARFHFGFTVPLESHFGSDAAIAAVARASGDLGLLRVEGHPSRGVWWQGLMAPDAPKVIARLPFMERPDHPAAMPVFVIARPGAAAAARDVVLYATRVEHWREGLLAVVGELGGEVLGTAADGTQSALLAAFPGHLSAAGIEARLAPTIGPLVLVEVGAHAHRSIAAPNDP